jgi:hypothetical protein
MAALEIIALNTTTPQLRAPGAGDTYSAPRLIELAANIKFPATQVPSADVNVLDDYEEGTWTPTLFGGTTAGTTTYIVQVGKYVKIGNIVTCTIALSISAKDGTGDVRIGNVPFNAGYWGAGAAFSGVTLANKQVTVYGSAGGTYLWFRDVTTGAIAFADMANISASFAVYGSFSFLI